MIRIRNFGKKLKSGIHGIINMIIEGNAPIINTRGKERSVCKNENAPYTHTSIMSILVSRVHFALPSIVQSCAYLDFT